ncbi:MAG: TolC family protein [Gemmatimonadetes bacterium]|nr:TolC family protein [Gemmatimonadota bacterium]
MEHVRRRAERIGWIGAGAIAGLLSGTVAVSAQTARPDPLRPLVTEALERNLGLMQARLAEEGAAAALREARGRWLPSLELQARYSEQNGAVNLGDFVNPANGALNELLGSTRFPTDIDVTLPFRHETRFRVLQPVFDERVRSGAALAREQHAGTVAARRSAARAVAAEAQIAWYAAAAARDAVGILVETLYVVEENERVAKRLVSAGRATPDVLHRARAERADVAQQLAEARERADATLRDVNRLLDRPLDSPFEAFTDAGAVARLPIPESTDALIARALASREELTEADAGIGAAGAAVRLATSSFVPSVALAVDYGWQGRDVSFGPDRDFAIASVVLSWRLSAGSDVARRQGAAIAEHRARVQRRELETAIELEVRQAVDAAQVAQAAIETADTRRQSAERVFELVRRRYEEGLASHIEFVDARTAMTAAQLNRSIASYRYAIRWVELERAAALREMEENLR